MVNPCGNGVNTIEVVEMNPVYVNCPRCKGRVATIDGDKVQCFNLVVRCVCGEEFGASKTPKDDKVTYIWGGRGLK